MVLTEQHSNAYKVGWALVAHALHPKRQPENAWAIAHPTKLRNSFQAAFGALEHNAFNGAAQQCVQSRVGTRCPRVAPKRQPENAWATSAHPTKLRNSFQAAFGALEYNGFNGAAQQCVQGRGGTRCPHVAPKRQPENAWATSAHPTKLRNSFQAAFGALEYNGFNGAAQQCVQGRGGTRCPHVAPPRAA